MIKIAHRGNFNGINKEMENNPQYLYNAISNGYDIEADFWYIDKKIYLGHDKPEYKIDHSFLFDVGENLWAHCKNIEMVYFLSGSHINYFWHQNDDCAITSKGFIWTLPDKKITPLTIVVDLENKYEIFGCYGVCSDFFN